MQRQTDQWHRTEIPDLDQTQDRLLQKYVKCDGERMIFSTSGIDTVGYRQEEKN